MMKKLFQRLLAPVAALLTLGSATATQAADTAVAHPALWEISDADTTIYLFGTIHLLPTNYQWRTAKFNDAVEGSQQLIVETIVDLDHPQSFASAFASMAISPTPLPPILDRVPPSKRAALQAALAKVGATPAQLDHVKTWAVAFQLLGLEFVALGLNGRAGPEAILRHDFTAENKSIGQLETNREQLSFFDGLPESAQQSLLEGSIENADAMKKEFGGMFEAWSKGDVEAIARTFDRDLSGSPALEQALIKQRNANWSKWIEQRMAQPGKIMIAVGAGHLAGRGSVIDLLKKDGYTVTRVQ